MTRVVTAKQTTKISVAAAIAGFAGLVHHYTGEDNALIVIQLSGDSRQLVVFCQTTFQEATAAIEAVLPLEGKFRAYCEGFSAGLALRRPDSITPEAELVLEVTAVIDETKASLVDDSGGLDPSLVVSLSANLARLIESGLREPQKRLSDLEYLEQHEIERLASAWVGPTQPYRKETIPELFGQTASAHPDRVALIEGDVRVTFKVLNERANRLARLLRTRGVRQGRRVGVCLPNSIECVTSILAVLKSGAAYVPLDPSHPSERLLEIAADARLRTVICHSATVFTFPRKIDIVELDTLDADIRELKSDDFDPECTPDSPAYVLYTSGSTGKPLGVVGIHRSITNGIAEAQFGPDSPDEVSCLNSPLSIGISLLLVFLPLLCGVPLVILSISEMRDPVLLAQAVAKYGVTTIGFSTPMLRLWLALGDRIAPSLRKVHSVVVGGAPLTPDLVDSFERIFPWATLENGYGSTEVGSIATRGRVTAGKIAIGRPISNTTVYLLGKNLRPVPSGATGEIFISSQHLALGYVNQPELTSARFLPDPFARMSGARMYRTGDLARHSPGGIEFLGRADDQTKVRGFRVHLSEVEAALAGQAGIASVAVATKETDGETRLVAYVVPVPGSVVNAQTLRHALRKRLPEYMIPGQFVELEHLPTTEGGKVNRKALPEVQAHIIDNAGHSSSGPNDEIAGYLKETWQLALQIDSIGDQDNFLNLGGDSLFAAMINARIWERYGIELTIEDLFNHPTIWELATEVARRSVGPSDGPNNAEIRR
jgi:amino acid adenylation domain-containing protein